MPRWLYLGLSSAWADEGKQIFTLDEVNRTLSQQRRADRLLDNELSITALSGYCNSADNNALFICHGVIEATVHTHEIMTADRPERRLYCAPPDLIPPQQVKGMLAPWIERHPTGYSLPAAFGVLGALREAFPCKPCLPWRCRREVLEDLLHGIVNDLLTIARVDLL